MEELVIVNSFPDKTQEEKLAMLKLLKNKYVNIPLFVDLYLSPDQKIINRAGRVVSNYRIYTRTEDIFIILWNEGIVADFFDFVFSYDNDQKVNDIFTNDSYLVRLNDKNIKVKNERDMKIAIGLSKRMNLFNNVFDAFYYYNIENNIIENLITEAARTQNIEVINELSKLLERRPNLKGEISSGFIYAKYYAFDPAIQLALKVSDDVYKYGHMIHRAYLQDKVLLSDFVKKLVDYGVSYDDLVYSVERSKTPFKNLFLSEIEKYKPVQ